MANLDWLRGKGFHSEIIDQKRIVENSEGVIFSDDGVDLVVELFEDNKRSLYLTESKKSLYQQRSKEEAIKSLRKLFKTAVDIAREDERKIIKRSDLAGAYNYHYCGVWPLCGGR